MAKEKKKRITITSYDPIEDPEVIISKDDDSGRREAFKETYRRIMKIIPEYFMIRKKRKNASSGGSGGFSQNIFVTSEKVTVETKEVPQEQNENEKEEKQIGD